MFSPQDIYLDKDFIDDLDKYKYIRYWASNAYARINKNLRNNSVDVLYNKYPHTFYFTKNFIEYIETYGINKDQLHKNVLYRGILLEEYPTDIHDNGFISFSYNKDIAKKFTQTDGFLFELHKNNIENSKMLLIDNNIDDIYNEKEVLMLPGKITLQSLIDKKYFKCSYKQNVNYIKSILDKPLPMLPVYEGGKKVEKRRLPSYTIKGGQCVVFYRCIYNRDVEILGTRIIPYTQKDVSEFMQIDLPLRIRHYEDATNLIPEVMDLRKYLKNAVYNDTNKSNIDEAVMKESSYNVYIALYNLAEKTVETIMAFDYAPIFLETFTVSSAGHKNKIEMALHNYFAYKSS